MSSVVTSKRNWEIQRIKWLRWWSRTIHWRYFLCSILNVYIYWDNNEIPRKWNPNWGDPDGDIGGDSPGWEGYDAGGTWDVGGDSPGWEGFNAGGTWDVGGDSPGWEAYNAGGTWNVRENSPGWENYKCCDFGDVSEGHIDDDPAFGGSYNQQNLDDMSSTCTITSCEEEDSWKPLIGDQDDEKQAEMSD